jgi:hypothetical protein
VLIGGRELKISVDIDGVLADQVGAVLKRIEKEYKLRYSKGDVNCTHWMFGKRDIWSEITKLLKDPEYVDGACCRWFTSRSTSAEKLYSVRCYS